MHIPDAYLSPSTEAAAFAAMTPLWAVAARRTARDLSTRQKPLLSFGAAFCFAVQMFNIPALGGTTAHALGATLLAILVGPWAALLGMTLTLAIQALLFGDGGILSLGANCWNMGFVACFVGYGVYKLIAGNSPAGSARQLTAAGIGAYAGTVLASLSAGIMLGLQPAIAHDAIGHALYCPFGLNVTLPAMTMTHLLIAGPAEAMITVAAVAYLWRAFPELAAAKKLKVGSSFQLARKFGWVIALTPVGLLASGSAWGEWDLSKLRDMVGYAPAGIAHSHELIRPMLPDYGFAGLSGRPWEIAGYLASAMLGCALVAGFTRGLVAGGRCSVAGGQRPVAGEALGREMPAWMKRADGPLPAAQGMKSPWLERTLLKMRTAVAKSVGSEVVARSPGFLQAIHPTVKTFGFLAALIATALLHSPWILLGLLVLTLALAHASKVSVASLAARVGSAVLFFGSVVAVPLYFQAGPSAASMILLRLACGITLAIVWNLTTRWHQLLASLKSIGVPKVFLGMAALTYRYLFVTMETLAEMIEARKSRQIGPLNKNMARSYAGSGTAILFAKSMAFTDEMHLAMVSRSIDHVI